jgi:hypothetical protein
VLRLTMYDRANIRARLIELVARRNRIVAGAG